MTKRLISCTASDLAAMDKPHLLEAIAASEGRVLACECIGITPPLLTDVTNAEYAAALSADLLLLNMFDVRQPVIQALPPVPPAETVRELKRLTGRPVGINLEPVDPALAARQDGSLWQMSSGRLATPENARIAAEMGVDMILLTGNPGNGVTNHAIARALCALREAVGSRVILAAGKMHAAGVRGEGGSRILTPADAGAVIETFYGQGSGEQYIPCAAGTIKNNTSVPAADVAAEAGQPLPFAVELNSPDPQVLIMHTHATECYRPASGLWCLPGDGARTTDRDANMCAVGRVIADTLNAAGINTLHDETLNDYPSYTGSYSNSRAVVQQYLAQYPSIKVVLDVHRDAIENDAGARMAPVAEIDGRKAAQVMLICGCDNGDTVSLPNWRQNLRFAAAWEGKMEGMYPGLTRPVLFSYRFYNQDLTTGSLLLEVGTHGNNLNEALYAGQLAAKALAALFTGS